MPQQLISSNELGSTPVHNSSTTMSLQTGGTTALYIDGSQRVGIGTTSPNRLFDVNGSMQTRNTNTNLSYVYFASDGDPSSSYSYLSGDGIDGRRTKYHTKCMRYQLRSGLKLFY